MMMHVWEAMTTARPAAGKLVPLGPSSEFVGWKEPTTSLLRKSPVSLPEVTPSKKQLITGGYIYT